MLETITVCDYTTFSYDYALQLPQTGLFPIYFTYDSIEKYIYLINREIFMDLAKVLTQIDDVLYTWLLIYLLAGSGIYFTIRTRSNA